MMHLSEEDQVLLYYGEPGAPANARTHLGECAQCRREAEALAETLDVCSQWEQPDMDLRFGKSVWAQLAPQLEMRGRRPGLRWFVTVTAVAALVIMAFVAGRISSRRPGGALTAGLSPQAQESILAITVADHLERAEVLLTQVSNADNSDTEGFALEREQAKDLVTEGRLLRQMLADQNSSALPLLDELERFTLEVANAPDRIGPAEIAGFRRRVGSESLLFKVRIIESNLRTQGQRL